MATGGKQGNLTLFSTLWRRISAFVIDILILMGVANLAAMFFGDTLVRIEPWGRFIGYLVTALYFGIMDSYVTGGRTVGKKILQIKVVNILGEAVNPIRCYIRSSIILLPFFIYGIMLPPSSFLSFSVVVITFCFLAILIGLIYFYLFNGRTRQSFHDIATGTYVVRTQHQGKLAASDVRSRNVPPVHYFIFTALLAVSFGVSIMADQSLKKPFKEFGIDYRNVVKINTAMTTIDGVVYSTMNTGNGEGGRYVSCDIYVKDKHLLSEATAKQVANIIRESYKDYPNVHIMAISINYGFDLGIARKWKHEVYQLANKR